MPSRTPEPESPTPLHLDELALALPKPDRGALESLLTPEARAAFAAQGAKIASSKVLVDASRIFGLSHAFYKSASPAQREALVGFSLELLALAVDAARRLRDLTAATGSDSGVEVAAFAEREARLRAAHGRALGLRDQAETVLIGLVGPAAEARARVRKSVGNAESPESLAAGLDRLAALGRELLADKEGPAAALARLRKVPGDFFGRLDAMAKELRAAATAYSAPSRPRPSQGDIDLLDGINLYLLIEISRAFDAAHDLDPTIPRLLPNATRRLFANVSRGKDQDPAPAPGPA